MDLSVKEKRTQSQGKKHGTNVNTTVKYVNM